MMKVRELIQHLSRLDPDTEVVAAHDYGDITHRVKVEKIQICQERLVHWSEYMRSRQVATDEDVLLYESGEEVLEKAEIVIVLMSRAVEGYLWD